MIVDYSIARMRMWVGKVIMSHAHNELVALEVGLATKNGGRFFKRS